MKSYNTILNIINSCKEQLTKLHELQIIAANKAVSDFKKNKNKSSPVNRKPSGFIQEYKVTNGLKDILDSNEFKDYIMDTKVKDGITSYDINSKDPKITPSQLVDACRKYFTTFHDNKGLVSLEDNTTPVYNIFQEYLENLEDINFNKNYKPSKGSLDADRSNLSRIHMLSFTCAYLKWSNNA